MRMVLTAWAHFLWRLRTVFMIRSFPGERLHPPHPHRQRCSDGAPCAAASSMTTAVAAAAAPPLSLICPPAWRQRDSCWPTFCTNPTVCTTNLRTVSLSTSCSAGPEIWELIFEVWVWPGLWSLDQQKNQRQSHRRWNPGSPPDLIF